MAWAKQPKPLYIRGNINEAEAWAVWKKEFNIYLKAAELSEKPDVVKVGTLLNLIGKEANKIHDNFSFAPAIPESGEQAEDPDDYATVLHKFDKHFKVRDGRLQARIYFDRELKRGKNQPFHTWVSDVRYAAQKCQYPQAELDARIRDKLIAHCCDNNMLGKLMEVDYGTLTAEKTIDIIATWEARKNTNRKPKTCGRCGTSHAPDRRKLCPAYEKICSACSVKGHFSSVCKNRRTCSVEVDSTPDDTAQASNNDFSLPDVSGATVTDQRNPNTTQWTTQLKVTFDTSTRNIDFRFCLQQKPVKEPDPELPQFIPSKETLQHPNSSNHHPEENILRSSSRIRKQTRRYIKRR